MATKAGRRILSARRAKRKAQTLCLNTSCRIGDSGRNDGCVAAETSPRSCPTGIRLNVQVVTIVVRPNKANHPRLGLAVSRRVARSAVARHRLKRHIRESFRHHTESLAGLDIVVLANSGAAKMHSGRLRRLLARGWCRAAGVVRRNEQGRQRREPRDGN